MVACKSCRNTLPAISLLLLCSCTSEDLNTVAGLKKAIEEEIMLGLAAVWNNPDGREVWKRWIDNASGKLKGVYADSATGPAREWFLKARDLRVRGTR